MGTGSIHTADDVATVLELIADDLTDGRRLNGAVIHGLEEGQEEGYWRFTK